MVIVLRVRLALFGVEEVVTGDELEDHAGQGPDVRREIILALEDDLGGAVLARLNHIGVVRMLIARIPHVDDTRVKHRVTDSF